MSEVMSTVQATAIQKALALLHASGARYCVLAADGTKYGTLEVSTQPQATGRKKRTRRHNHVAKHGYIVKLAEAKVGDIVEFVCDSKAEAASLAGSMAAQLGPNGSITEYGSMEGGRFFARCLVVLEKAKEAA